ncbi:MAG: DUF1848 family protein [Eggerthella lenta]
MRNPAVRTRVSRVILSPDTVDCVAFWTKDPSVLLARKTELDRVCPSPYFVQFTLNAYGADVEAGLPRKARLLETFRSLADALGPDRVVWRYSPILLGGAYDIAHHMQWFEAFAARLEGSTRTCRISFLDMYPEDCRSHGGARVRRSAGRGEGRACAAAGRTGRRARHRGGRLR